MNNINDNIYDLITSERGPHITIYLPRPSTSIQAKNLLKVAITKCTAQMEPAIDKMTIDYLLGPIKGIAEKPDILSGFTTNIGIFRNEKFLRIVSVPLDTSFATHVADSFHVKPLLDSSNRDYQYLFFGVSGNMGYLYKGNSHDYKLISEYNLLDASNLINDESYIKLRSKIKRQQYVKDKNLHWIAKSIFQLSAGNRQTLFTSVGKKTLHKLSSLLHDANVNLFNLRNQYSVLKERLLHKDIQNLMTSFKMTCLENSIQDFRDLQNAPDMIYNISEIALAAKSGYIEKIIIASNCQLFGRIKEDGSTVLHQFDTNHEDDDLLDDIAQLVFKNGGEIIVAPQSDIPNNNIIMALLKNPERSNAQLRFRLLQSIA